MSPRILRWLLHFCKICGPLYCRMAAEGDWRGIIYNFRNNYIIYLYQQLQYHHHSFISIQPWRPGLAGTRAQSCDRYGSGTLHPGHVLGGSLPLLSPTAIYIYLNIKLYHKRSYMFRCFCTIFRELWYCVNNNNNNNNIYLLQLGCHPVTVVILHVNKTWNWLLINLSREGYMRSM